MSIFEIEEKYNRLMKKEEIDKIEDDVIRSIKLNYFYKIFDEEEEVEFTKSSLKRYYEYADAELMDLASCYSDVSISEINDNLSIDKEKNFSNYFICNDDDDYKIKELLIEFDEEDNEKYNPLYLYGPSGTGKTHLVMAIANKLLNENKKVTYVTIDKFIEYLVAAKFRGTEIVYETFINKIHESDYVIIEDMQFLTNGSYIQMELVKIFEFLYNNKKKIIITSDRKQDDLKNAEPRVKNRFQWGLTWDMNYLSDKSRMDIINYFSKNNKLKFDENVKSYLCDLSKNRDIRYVYGFINRIAAYKKIYPDEIYNLEKVKDILEPFSSELEN